MTFNFYENKIKLRNKNFHLKFWDNSGNTIYSSLIVPFYKKAKISLIFYDALDRDSFEAAKLYFKDIKKKSEIVNHIFILVRNKYENILNINANNDIVDDEEALEYADKNGLYFFIL